MNKLRDRPFAKVKCPVEVVGMSTGLCLTCYATGDADTFFSVPARTRYKGRYIAGFMMRCDDVLTFIAYEKYLPVFAASNPALLGRPAHNQQG